MALVTKNRFFVATSLISAIVGVYFAFVLTAFCRTSASCSILYENQFLFSAYLLLCVVVIPLFPISVISYFLPERSFQSLKKFVILSLPILGLSVSLTLMGIGRMGNAFIVATDYTPYLFAFIYGFFFLTSLIIIVISVLRKD